MKLTFWYRDQCSVSPHPCYLIRVMTLSSHRVDRNTLAYIWHLIRAFHSLRWIDGGKLRVTESSLTPFGSTDLGSVTHNYLPVRAQDWWA